MKMSLYKMGQRSEVIEEKYKRDNYDIKREIKRKRIIGKIREKVEIF